MKGPQKNPPQRVTVSEKRTKCDEATTKELPYQRKIKARKRQRKRAGTYHLTPPNEQWPTGNFYLYFLFFSISKMCLHLSPSVLKPNRKKVFILKKKPKTNRVSHPFLLGLQCCAFALCPNSSWWCKIQRKFPEPSISRQFSPNLSLSHRLIGEGKRFNDDFLKCLFSSEDAILSPNVPQPTCFVHWCAYLPTNHHFPTQICFKLLLFEVKKALAMLYIKRIKSPLGENHTHSPGLVATFLRRLRRYILNGFCPRGGPRQAAHGAHSK